jgi:hypothetical protein
VPPLSPLLLVVLCIVVAVWSVLLSFYVYLYYVWIACLDAGLLARSQYSEGPVTGHLDTGFSWFPCVYKQMLSWFPTFQVATTCFSCSPSNLNLLATNFIFCIHAKWPLPLGDNPIVVNKYYELCYCVLRSNTVVCLKFLIWGFDSSFAECSGLVEYDTVIGRVAPNVQTNVLLSSVVTQVHTEDERTTFH